MSKTHKCARSAISAILGAILLAITASADATWSIIAVDRETGEVGVAGASCTFNVMGIAEIVPGKGAVVVQAMSNNEARHLGVEMMRDGATPEQIVEAMRDAKFDPENQQYAVVVLDADLAPATYSGAEISDWNGSATGDGVSVQGNILVDERVITDAMAAFEASAGEHLADRLVTALEAGANAGGDSRCGDQHATSAFVTVYEGDVNARRPYLHLVLFGGEEQGEPAVEHLVEEFNLWRKHGSDHTSTRMFFMP